MTSTDMHWHDCCACGHLVQDHFPSSVLGWQLPHCRHCPCDSLAAPTHYRPHRRNPQ